MREGEELENKRSQVIAPFQSMQNRMIEAEIELKNKFVEPAGQFSAAKAYAELYNDETKQIEIIVQEAQQLFKEAFTSDLTTSFLAHNEMYVVKGLLYQAELCKLITLNEIEAAKTKARQVTEKEAKSKFNKILEELTQEEFAQLKVVKIEPKLNLTRYAGSEVDKMRIIVNAAKSKDGAMVKAILTQSSESRQFIESFDKQIQAEEKKKFLGIF